ncbi:MAG: cytochrome c family protein [Alphaproteobacteria bacterium]
MAPDRVAGVRRWGYHAIMNAAAKAVLTALALGLASLGTAAGDDGDARAGERVWRGRCAACHTIAQGDPHRVGPNLHGIYGSIAASRPGFNYSQALRAAGSLVWDAATLNAWLERPAALVPGTRMTFPGLARDIDRSDVIAYLRASGAGAPAR